MGTRALIRVIDTDPFSINEEEETLVTIFKQHDGFPHVLGKEIKEILNNGDVKLVNGYSLGDKVPEVFNGMGCLAAYLIGKLKGECIGGIYITKTPTEGVEEEYIYELYPVGARVSMGVWEVLEKGYKPLFKGELKDFKIEREA